MLKYLLPINLRLFDDGGAAAAGAGGEGTGTAEGSLATGKADGVTEVQYGYGHEQNQLPATDDGSQSSKKSFDELVNGDYREEFNQRVQRAVTDRVKNLQQYKTQYEEMSPVLDILSERYGIDATDAEQLREALENDDAYYENEAIEKGLTVDQLKEFKRVERENLRFKQEAEERMRAEHADRQYEEWQQQFETLKADYPEANLENELANDEFKRMLSAGVNMRTAFEVTHLPDLMTGAMRYAINKAQESAVNNIMARGSRPSENGISSKSSAVIKTDPSKFTAQDFKEIEKRVQRGEKIYL